MKNKNVGLENLKGFRIGADSEVKDLIPSGHAELDHAISADIVREHTKFKLGGFPLGKVILFYGNEGGGKVLLLIELLEAPREWDTIVHGLIRSILLATSWQKLMV